MKDSIFIDNTNAILDNARGIAIVFIKVLVGNIFRADLSYHLHFLISTAEDKSKDRYITICLDTGAMIGSSIEEINNNVLILSEGFIDNIIYAYKHKQDISKYCFLNKEDQPYWDRFNVLKERAFGKNMGSILHDTSQGKYSEQAAEKIISKDKIEAFMSITQEVIDTDKERIVA